MTFKIHEESGNIVVIDCPERVDSDHSEALKKILTASVDKSIFRIVINLTQTNYVDSSGLGAIVSRIAAARSNGGDIKIALTSPFIIELLAITNLNKILKCYEDVAAAVASY